MKQYLIITLLSIAHVMSAMNEVKTILSAETEEDTTQENYTNPALSLERQKKFRLQSKH